MVVQGYTWYYFSGLRKAINRIQEALVYLDQVRDRLSQQKPPSQVLLLLRRAVKSYVAFPGSNFVVDQVFDAVDDKVDAHGDEANALIATAYTQIRELIQQDGGKLEILRVLQNLTKQLQPNSLELKEMAEKYEVKKRLDDGLTAATAAIAVAKAKLQDSKVFGQLQKVWVSRYVVVILALIHFPPSNTQVENPFRRKPVNDVPLDTAADETPLKSDDNSLDPPQPAADATPLKSADDL